MLHANYSYVTFFCFPKKNYPSVPKSFPLPKLFLKKFSSFLHILYKDQIKLVTTILWSLDNKFSCLLYILYKDQSKLVLYLLYAFLFWQADSLSCFTLTYFDLSLVSLFVILVVKVEVSISHSCKVRLLWFLFQSTI